MHGMQYGHLGQKLKGYLHIDQTPKIRVDSTWQFGLLVNVIPNLDVFFI